MPEITVHIGGRDFEVVCKAGEEPFLQSAATILDVEAQALTGAMGRIPESRMLLMSGLMLADKTASLEDQVKASALTKEGTAKSQDASAEVALLQDDLKAAQKTIAELEKELAESEENMSTALEAMERMVVGLEEKTT